MSISKIYFIKNGTENNNLYSWDYAKNKKFTKLKYLDLQSIKTEATYEKKFQTLFGK